MNSFEPITKKTVSIPKTLEKLSQEKHISIKDIDFILKSHETLLRQKGKENDEILEDTKNIDKKILFDQNTRIYQKYEIEIFPLETKSSSYKITLASNKNKTKVIAVIKAGSVFSEEKDLVQKLLVQIWQKKLAGGFLIDIFEESLQTQLKKLVQLLPYGKKISKDIKFSVANGIEPLTPHDGELEIFYGLEKTEEKNFIDGVKTGELVLRYTKPKNGQGGRSCEGIYIPEGGAKDFTIPQTDDTIILKENDQFIDFYANDNGFVEYEDDILKISKTLKLEGADHKTTGHLDAKDLKDEISVDITHNKELYDDAIGSGLKVDVKDLNVDGSIGANVNVSANSVNIDAQTHQKTTLEVADKANIKLHRGDLIAEHAEIEILETGKITAHQSIHVKKIIGGELSAPKIYIDELVSNAKVIASELIEIKTISGSNNLLIIDPDKIEAYHKKREQLEDEIKEYKKRYKEESDLLAANIKEHSAQIDRIKTFQKRIIAAQSSGKTPMKQDMIRVREYKRESQVLHEKQESLKNTEMLISNMESDLEKLLNQDLHGEIKTDSSYDGNIRVIFVNPKDSKEVVLMPQGKHKVISLILDEQGNRVIRLTDND